MICPLKHWIAYSPSVALQQTDHTLQHGRSSVFKLFICRWRPATRLEWERGEGEDGCCTSPANKAHVQI